VEEVRLDGEGGKETVLDLVPFGRARRQIADRDGESRLLGQLLQFPLPQAHPRAVAVSAIGADEQASQFKEEMMRAYYSG
jgi:hypothetical protein